MGYNTVDRIPNEMLVEAMKRASSMYMMKHDNDEYNNKEHI